jgi:hypothetical protein
MKTEKTIDIRVRLSTLWIVVMINMIFADIFSIMVELVNGNTLNIPGDVKTVMAIAALVTNVPILMIYLSRVLTFKINRILNMIAAVFTMIYVIGGGDFAPHYIIIASIEVIVLLLIVVYAWKWTMVEKQE